MSRADKPFLLPFGIFLLFLGLNSILQTELGGSESPWLSSPQYWIFPVQTIVCAGLVIFWWREYPLGAVRRPLLTIGIAISVLLLWIFPQAFLGFKERRDGFDPTFFSPDSWLYSATVVMRFVRLAIVVPFVEEIFWRGWLMRWLINERIETVPFGQFQWRAFLITTVGFTLEHQMADWPAAILCGVAYNFIAIRTRSLSSCILAHAITNLLLGFYVMQTRQWGFW